MPMKPCIDCGRLTRASRCRTCSAASPYQTANWRQVARAVTAAAGRCERCGSTNRLTAHHRIPRAEGGPDAAWNLETLCMSCHNRVEAERRRGIGGVWL